MGRLSTPEKVNQTILSKPTFYVMSNLGSMQRYDLTKKIERKSKNFYDVDE